LLRKRYFVSLGIFLTLWAIPAQADMIWPAAVYEGRLLSVPVIAAGLVLEWLFYLFGLKLGWKKAAFVDIVINMISTIAGVLCIPIAGLLWEIFPGFIIYKKYNMGSFSPITWTYTFFIAVLITTMIEIYAAKNVYGIVASKKNILVFLLANTASVGVVFIFIFVFPVRID
jgi:hypothetical protein